MRLRRLREFRRDKKVLGKITALAERGGDREHSTIVYALMGVLLIKIIRWLISKEPQVKSNS